MVQPPIVQPREHALVRRICVTGPECTGKSTLAQRLAAHFGAELVPEAARLYAERVDRVLTSDDVERIAAEHIMMADVAARRVVDRGGGTLVLDQDLVSTVVYGKDYYAFSSPWLQGQASRRQADLYLLCDVDVPWVGDGVRDRPIDRASMFDLFATALTELAAPVAVIRGDWEDRWQLAVAACHAALDES